MTTSKPIITVPQGAAQGRQSLAPDTGYVCAICGLSGRYEDLCAPIAKAK